MVPDFGDSGSREGPMIGEHRNGRLMPATMRFVSLSTLLTVPLVLRGEAGADAAILYTSTDGRTLMPMEATEVVMVAETVLVTPAGEAGWFLDPMGVKVECVFHFMNAGTDTVVTEVGFPFEAVMNSSSVIRDYLDDEDIFSGLDGYRELVESGRDPETAVPEDLGFRAVADGEPRRIEYRFGEPDHSARHEFYPLWAVWDMSFPPGEDVVLECGYNTAFNIMAYDGFDLDFTYIARTGALWAGPIGSALIEVQVPDSIPLPGLGFDRACWWDWTGSPHVEGRTITWRFTDWEPETDLTFRASGELEMGSRGMLDIESDAALLFDWTSGEGLLKSAITSLWEEYSISSDSRTHAWVLGKICEVQNGLSAGHPSIYYYPDERIHPEWTGVLEELDSILSSDMALVESAGFAPLLPMFSLRTDWSGFNPAMYGAYPSLEARYLAVLSHLERAVGGDPPADPVLRSLFRLTGWFVEGIESPLGEAFARHGFPGAVAEDSVIAWWTQAAAVPLVPAAAARDSVSEVPFAFRSPSPPFPDTPQVNSVLNDGDLLTGWRSGLEGGGHGEILEVFVFPLPGMEPTIVNGLRLVNGFGWEPGLPRGHIVRVLVSADGLPVCTADLSGGPAWQCVEFPEPLEDIRTLSLEIIESVPGGTGSSAGISELRLY